MSGLILNAGAAPNTPAAGKARSFLDSTLKRFFTKEESGRIYGSSHNGSIAAQAGFAADTYLTDSDLLIPSFGLQVRTLLRWTVSVSKTAAGVAAPTYSIRIGAARSTADTARVALVGPAQTAVADDGIISIFALVRSIGVGVLGVIQADMNFDHNLAATGFATNATAKVAATGAGFDTSALGGLYAGLSINGGAAAAWTVTQVRAEALW